MILLSLKAKVLSKNHNWPKRVNDVKQDNNVYELVTHY
jgi:hypothetical protein